MKLVVGVDEAGRGPLAGPVSIGVAVVPANFDWESKLAGVTDSKKLSEKKREEIFLVAKELKKTGQIDYAVAMVSAGVIDKKGIARAIPLGIARAIKRLKLDPTNCYVKLDGSLRAPEVFLNQETIIKGDAKEQVIGLASILAKVTRDRYMVRKSAEQIFAPYDFHIHKGYGTKSHCAAIRKYGLSEMHRRSYCKNIITE